MSINPKSAQRQKLLDRYLAGEIDREEYDRLLAELQEVNSDSVVTAVPVEVIEEHTPEIEVATSDYGTVVRKSQPFLLIEPGVKLDRFRVDKCLGRGGMGEVWKACDVIGERDVVLKLLHPEFVHHPEELASVKQMFRRVHDLQHQNICPLYLLGHDERFGYYVVMKYIEGETLSTYRRRYVDVHGYFPVPELTRILAPIAAALDYAHSQKILHCDVKPQNMMIGPDGQTVQLVDFGLAAEIRSTASRMKANSVEYGGTYPYMSPEQWLGEMLDGKSDQYALAVVAYELLSGRRPFDATDPAVLRLCVLEQQPKPLPNLDSTANAALMRALSKSKSDRFDTCLEFLNALSSNAAGHFIPPYSPTTSTKWKMPLSDQRTKTAGSPSDSDPKLDKSVSQRRQRPDEADSDRDSPDSSDEIENENVSESPISRANRQAVFWVSAIAGLFVVTLLGVAMIGGGYLLSLAFQSDKPLIEEKIADQIVGSVNQPTAVDKTVPPVAIESPPRYKFQIDHAHVYSVNLEISQDQDRVLSYTGDLAYIATTPSRDNGAPEREIQGTGTAFVVHPDGYLLTCHHVTNGATKLEVTLAEKTYPATVLAEDPEHDLAVLRIEATQLPFLKLADSDAVQQGEDVRAFGFPLSSILGENIKATRGSISGINMDEGRKVFQIDGSINPGNSGGPLVNENGEVVGVIYAKLVEDLASGVGFATPVNDTKVLLKGQDVQFTEGRSANRLEGPALVKQVSAATALVSVTAAPGSRLSKNHVSLRCDGSLTPRSWRRSGQPGDGLDPQGSGKSLVFTPDGTAEVDQVETDSLGRIHAVTGRGNLPQFLGQAARMIVERLPLSRQKKWSDAHAITISIQQQPERIHSGNLPFGPRVAPPFGPFGPRGFGNQSVPRTREYPGSMRIDYTLGDKADRLQTIHKSFELKTDELVAAGPRIQLKGQGDFVFDTQLGLPHQLDMTAELVENDPDKSTTTPLKLSYKFVDVRKLAAGHIPSKPVPPPATATGKPVEADSVVEVGSKLLCEWAGRWKPIKVLALNDDRTIRIHWEGWGDQWDEDVPRTRLRFLAN